jgi:DNA-binding CsgD family transcriptional regulator
MMRVSLTSVERALLRLLVSGYGLEDAAQAVGLSAAEARALLAALQARLGVTSDTRLLALALLQAWV